MAKSPQKKFNSSHETLSSLVWGVHPILELLRSKPRTVHSIHILQGKGGSKLQSVIDLARENGIKIKFVSRFKTPETNKINHQGVIANVMPQATIPEEDFLTTITSKKSPLILALDSIQDPHNLGAIIRTAVAAEADGLILPKDRSAPLTGTVLKISAGALPHLPICLTTNLVRMLQKLKEKNIWVCSTLKDAQQSIYEADFTIPLCLVIGSEEKGVRPLVQKQCDIEVTVPMNSAIDSLNASVAAAVVLFEIKRQRSLA